MKESQDKGKSLVKWILSQPEGKQFLAATLIVIVTLTSAIVWLYIRNESYRKEEIKIIEKYSLKIQECEQEKQEVIRVANKRFLDFLIIVNNKNEKTQDKLDSLSFEILKLKNK